MGLIPLRDTMTIIKQNTSNKLDDWGVPIYVRESVTYKCHIAYNYKLDAVAIGQGKTEVFTAKIYLKGKVVLKEEDKVSFTDMSDTLVEKSILQVKPIRDFNGRILYTCVFI